MKAFCFYCGKVERLKKDGTMKQHGPRRKVVEYGLTVTKRCDGSGRDPKEWKGEEG